MPYKPTFPSPYMQAISASKDGGNVFRCLINPRDSVYGYELTISSAENELKEADETTETETHTISRTVDGMTKSVDGSDVALEVGDSELPVIGSSAEDSWLAVVVPKGLLTDGRSYTWRIKLFGSKVDVGQQNIVVAEGLSGTYYNEPQYNRFKLSGNPIIVNNGSVLSTNYGNGFEWYYDQYFLSDVWWSTNTDARLREYGLYKYKDYEGLYNWNTLPNIKDMFITYKPGSWGDNVTYDLGYRRNYSVKSSPLDYFIPRRNNNKVWFSEGYATQGYHIFGRLGKPIVFIDYLENIICLGQIIYSPVSEAQNEMGLMSGNSYDASLESENAGALISLGSGCHADTTYNTVYTPNTSTGQFVVESCSLKNSLAYSGTSLPSNIQKGQYVLYKNNGQNIYTRITAVDLYDGQVFLGLESPIPLSNESKNVSFSVVSNYVESTDFYFNTRTEPNVSITIKNLTSSDGDTVVLSSPILEAIGLYTQQQSIPIESYVFNLYSSDGELINTSGDVISSKITYTYKGLMTNRNYTLELAVTNDDGVVTKVEKEISCIYSDGDSDISTCAYFVTDKNDYTETPAYNAGSVCIVISNESTTTPYFCNVIRRDVKTDEIKIIATDVAVDMDDTIMISDYTAQSGRAYRYMVTPFNDKRTAFISAETGEVTSNLAGVMLYDLTPTADKKVFNVTKNSVYLFDTDLQFGELKLNNTKNYTETYSAYPHEAYTKNNHLVGSVETLLGTYNCDKDYVGDGIDRMDDFKKLAVNGHLKLIKDRMGHCIIGDIEDVSYSYVRENGKDMTKLSFNFTELADSKSITVYAEG